MQANLTAIKQSRTLYTKKNDSQKCKLTGPASLSVTYNLRISSVLSPDLKAHRVSSQRVTVDQLFHADDNACANPHSM